MNTGSKRKTFYLWRPFLRDPKDDFILELAVESQSKYIMQRAGRADKKRFQEALKKVPNNLPDDFDML